MPREGRLARSVVVDLYPWSQLVGAGGNNAAHKLCGRVQTLMEMGDYVVVTNLVPSDEANGIPA
jgi:hypothetical protein